MSDLERLQAAFERNLDQTKEMFMLIKHLLERVEVIENRLVALEAANSQRSNGKE